jgi:single-strand DNA-binding protein
MTMIASVHGRLTADPVRRTTKAGKDMTTVTLAVDVTGNSDEAQTMFVGLLAFNRAADDLARAAKGETCTAMGKVTKSIYTPAGGEPREQWSLLADTVVVAKSARPSGRKASAPSNQASRRESWEQRGDEMAF